MAKKTKTYSVFYREFIMAIVPVILISLLGRVVVGAVHSGDEFAARLRGQSQSIEIGVGENIVAWFDLENVGTRDWAPRDSVHVEMRGEKYLNGDESEVFSTLSMYRGETKRYFLPLRFEDVGTKDIEIKILDKDGRAVVGISPIVWNFEVSPSDWSFEPSSSLQYEARPGKEEILQAKYKNTGNTVWHNFGERKVGLGVDDRGKFLEDEISWIDDKNITYLDQSSVYPGEEGTFTFDVGVPLEEKTYNFSLKPFVERVDKDMPGSEAIIEVSKTVFTSEPYLSRADETEVDELSLYAFAVGHGDAFLLRTPEGENILVDSGHPMYFNSVTYKLASLGVKKLDYVFLTHSHWDHIGGMPYILDNFEVGEIIINGEGYPYQTYARLLDRLLGSELEVKKVKRGDKINLSNGYLEVLNPSKILVGKNTDDLEVNNNSLVLSLVYDGERKVLFPGDITAPVVSDFIGSYPAFFDAEVVISPHHGDADISETKFAELLKAGVVVVSNSYEEIKELDSDYLAALTRDRLFISTGQDGDLAFEWNGDMIKYISDTRSGFYKLNRRYERSN